MINRNLSKILEKMAINSEAAEKLRRAQRHLEAAETLDRAGLLEQSVTMHWIAIRTTLFAWLEQQNIAYSSTRGALVAAMRNPELFTIRDDLEFIHIIGTLAEWDEKFNISQVEMLDLKSRCKEIRERLTP